MPPSRHGPKPITVTRPIAAPSSEVWAVISAPGYVEEVHPFCAANPVYAWPGAASHDTVRYYNGREVERRFTSWRDGQGYDLEASDANGPAASVAWRLTQVAASSTLTLVLTPRMLDAVPTAIRWAPGTAVRVMMRRYLGAVLRGVEWRVATGRPVRRNQFGSHPWFSPRA